MHSFIVTSVLLKSNVSLIEAVYLNHDVICFIVAESNCAVHNPKGDGIIEWGSALDGYFRAGDETHLSDSSS